MMTAAFKAGTISGATKISVTPEIAPGNHLAYSVGTTTFTDGAVIGAIVYVPGNNITGVKPGNVVNLYELTPENRIVTSVVHILTAREIKN